MTDSAQLKSYAWPLAIIFGVQLCLVAVTFPVTAAEVIDRDDTKTDIKQHLHHLRRHAQVLPATMIGLLTLNGVGSAQAIAATIILRVATLWFGVAVGLCCALLPPSPAVSPAR